MEPQASSPAKPRLKAVSKRPDSMRVELLTIHEDSVPKAFTTLESHVNIGFRKLSYSVREGIFKSRRRKLLKEINGDFYAGELTAIIGPSGSGKSTLMNILAGYTTNSIRGKLLTNEEIRDEALFRTNSCYIMQDDNLQPLLTVMEAMNVAANLKFNSEINSKERQSRVKEILEGLGLWECRDVRTHSLSGGQRKRLSIALELLKNPQVMFFDEPTSGLDSVSTKQCIMLLKQLAQEGKTVIITIHQPSASVFQMFDHVYAIAHGMCIYQGSIKGLIPYLEQSGLQCPPYHNPADYLLEVAVGEHGDHNERLTGRAENGLSKEWRKSQRDTLQIQSIEHIDKMMKSGLLTPVKVPSFNFPLKTKAKGSPTKKCFVTPYSSTFLCQFYVLLKRTFVINTRDKTLTISRIGTHSAIALIIGILYFGIGKEASNVLNNFNFMFFSVMFLMLTAFNCILTTVPAGLPITIIEHFNRWYSLKAYYLAITLADLPIQLTATLIYGMTTYFLTSQPLETFRVMLFLVMCVLISLVSQSFGLLIGIIMDIKNGVIFGPFFVLPFIIFSGFFVQLNNTPTYLHWLFHISFIKYGFEGLNLAIFGYGRGKLPCNADYCHFVHSEKFLDEVDMEDAQYSYCVYFLVGLVIFLRILGFAALALQIKLKR